jgi:prepilin-type N-terminal cleavage/methylation domain-containing protein
MIERLSKKPRDRLSGFTLIEVIAVVAIISMVFAVGLPRLSGSQWDALNSEAANIAEYLRFARQRAIMTGVPHRLLLDLEEGGYQIEWFVSEERALGGASADDGFGSGGLLGTALESLGSENGPSIEMVPPRVQARDYFPIQNREMGTFHWLEDELYFVGVEGASGWIEGGDYPIVFYVDGTTESARLEIADADDRHVTLEIEPILERVHVREGGARL